MKPPFTKRRLRTILRRAHDANGVIRRYPAATAERKLGTLRVGRITPEALSADTIGTADNHDGIPDRAQIMPSSNRTNSTTSNAPTIPEGP